MKAARWEDERMTMTTHIDLVSRRDSLPLRADKEAKPPNSYVDNIVCPFIELVYGTNPCEEKVIQR